MSEDVPQTLARPAKPGMIPHEDARAIIRLFQCSQCSYPLRDAMTLPCGNSICKPCIPPVYTRTNITYPQNADRAQGFQCPFHDCGMEHSLADCSLDVALNKLFGVIKTQMSSFLTNSTEVLIQLDEKLDWPRVVGSSIDVMPRSRVLYGGRVAATYNLADMGELNYYSELSYSSVNEDENEIGSEEMDVMTVNNIRDSVRGEMECHVCYGLMLDPLTTPCGHTFCRKCVARILDHSNLCPTCRRPLLMRPGVAHEPSNKRISALIESLLAEELAARIIAVQQEEAFDEEGWLPLFPCTLAYPQMPTFLHIFEPRYRLMIRRCVENGSRKFGMMMYNSRSAPQGSLGRSTFMLYGTVLHIRQLQMFSDGRSLLETQGVHRFKVLEAKMQDGYNVGRIQRIDDIPLAEEEALEASETSKPDPDPDDPVARINHMSTQALLQHGLDFISQARAQSADWLHERVLAAYGQPPTDPALFPYWFASVLPIADDQKYLLLPITSVRERLKMTAKWIQRLEAARCLYEAAVAERVRQMAARMQAENEDESEDEEETPDNEDATTAEARSDDSPSNNGQTEEPVAEASSNSQTDLEQSTNVQHDRTTN